MGITSKPTWSVVVFHEDAPMRDLAVTFCDGLVERFWARCGFEVDWISFQNLADSDLARVAGEKAARADMIVFAAQPGRELPLDLRAWVQSWVHQRQAREGSLVGLCGSAETACEPHFYLRHLAHHAGLDYLTQLPTHLAQIPETLEYCPQRADEKTAVLDSILRHTPPPTFHDS